MYSHASPCRRDQSTIYSLAWDASTLFDLSSHFTAKVTYLLKVLIELSGIVPSEKGTAKNSSQLENKWRTFQWCQPQPSVLKRNHPRLLEGLQLSNLSRTVSSNARNMLKISIWICIRFLKINVCSKDAKSFVECYVALQTQPTSVPTEHFHHVQVQDYTTEATITFNVSD